MVGEIRNRVGNFYMRNTPLRLAVLGDLHYEPAEHQAFAAARKQLGKLAPDFIVQLGDHGGYSHCGSWQSFEEGRDYLAGFGRPYHTLVGNHDLEGFEYATDAESVAAFCRAFGLERPYYAVDWGPALGIFLSSTRFRDNPHSHHEVYIDDVQVEWFERTLREHRERPTFVFSHAPIFGSGVRVLQSVHLMCPNAWLNHTDRPERFLRIVEDHRQIKLWFSAHNHLGQHYHDSISILNGCAFVHTGVIGEVSRDGRRHSRAIDCDDRGLTLHTQDHLKKTLVADLRMSYGDNACERLTAGGNGDSHLHFSPPAIPTGAERWEFGESVFALARGMLVEFDRALEAPLGVVAHGLERPSVAMHEGRLVVEDSAGRFEVAANSQGRFWQVYAPNPWREATRSA
jgi:hypothetical protein